MSFIKISSLSFCFLCMINFQLLADSTNVHNLTVEGMHQNETLLKLRIGTLRPGTTHLLIRKGTHDQKMILAEVAIGESANNSLVFADHVSAQTTTTYTLTARHADGTETLIDLCSYNPAMGSSERTETPGLRKPAGASVDPHYSSAMFSAMLTE